MDSVKQPQLGVRNSRTIHGDPKMTASGENSLEKIIDLGIDTSKVASGSQELGNSDSNRVVYSYIEE